MLNEFFCWLIGHHSFSGDKGEKLYKRDGRRFVYTGIRLYSCKGCNKYFIKVDKEISNLLPEVKDKDVPPMPVPPPGRILKEGKWKSNTKNMPGRSGLIG